MKHKKSGELWGGAYLSVGDRRRRGEVELRNFGWGFEEEENQVFI